MEKKFIRQLLKKYLLGQTNQQEKERVEQWFHSFEQDQPHHLSDTDRELVKTAIWQGIEPHLVPEKKIFRLPRLTRAAVWIALVAGVALFALFLYNKQQGRSAIAYTTFTTNPGERKTVTIKDGSRLTLNAGTTLKLYDDFPENRKVELVDGEVFFEVTKDPQRPFLVQNKELTVTVLGTSFNVSAYTALHAIHVGVITGKVHVQQEKTTLAMLTPSQQLVYDKQTHTYQTLTLDGAQEDWRSGRLPLNDVSFDEMVFLMKINFGIDIVADDPEIRNTRYTTELFTSMTGQQAVEVLAAIHQLKIKSNDQRIILLK